MMVYVEKKKKKEEDVTQFSYLHLSFPVYFSNVSSLNCFTYISVFGFSNYFFYFLSNDYLFLGKFAIRK